jgi:hypothetical protein
MIFKINKGFFYTFLSAMLILIGTLIAIQYAKGGFRLTNEGFVHGTGLLSANSFPTGAEVFINGRLTTATDDTLYLAPGEYLIEITKDGYSKWSKNLQISKELVTQTNALLFPRAPSLNTLTFGGARNLSPSPDGQKVIFYSEDNTSDRRNGLYILELSHNPFSFQKEPKQISNQLSDSDLESAKFIWSPDSSEVMLITDNREVLLDLNRVNNIESLPDISFRQRQILSEWEQEMYLRERESLSKFPPEIIGAVTQGAKNVYISPDRTKILYTATTELDIPDELIPTVLASSTQPEERSIVTNGIYVYDLEEDKNFRVGTYVGDNTDKDGELRGIISQQPDVPYVNGEAKPVSKMLLALDALDNNSPLITASPSAFNSLQATTSAETANNFVVYHSPIFVGNIQWFPNSKHLIYVQDESIGIMEYDSANKTNIYSGPFVDNFVYPWPNGDRLIILTSFNPNVPKNLYALELKK